MEEIHQYMHDNLYNQWMVELENLEPDKVHHQTKKSNLIIKRKFLFLLFYHLWIHIFFQISFT